MKTKKVIGSLINVGLSIGTVFGVAGCGQASAPVAPVVPAATASVATVQTACQAMAGVLNANGNACTFTTPMYGYALPANSLGYTSEALNSGYPVNPGDTVTVNYASGGWGVETVSTKTHFALSIIPYQSTSNSGSCDQYGVNGGGAPQNGGLPGGLIASDGTDAYFLGAAGTVTIQNVGTLSFGLNVPVGDLTESYSSGSNTESYSQACGGFTANITITSN